MTVSYWTELRACLGIFYCSGKNVRVLELFAQENFHIWFLWLCFLSCCMFCWESCIASFFTAHLIAWKKNQWVSFFFLVCLEFTGSNSRNITLEIWYFFGFFCLFFFSEIPLITKIFESPYFNVVALKMSIVRSVIKRQKWACSTWCDDRSHRRVTAVVDEVDVKEARFSANEWKPVLETELKFSYTVLSSAVQHYWAQSFPRKWNRGAVKKKREVEKE